MSREFGRLCSICHTGYRRALPPGSAVFSHHRNGADSLKSESSAGDRIVILRCRSGTFELSGGGIARLRSINAPETTAFG